MTQNNRIWHDTEVILHTPKALHVFPPLDGLKSIIIIRAVERINPQTQWKKINGWLVVGISNVLGGGFKHFLCSSLFGEMIQFD